MNVEVEGRQVRVTNLDRVLWPAVGVTKADLIRYYTDVAAAVLPHLAGHPITLHRFPEGVEGPHFFQTRAPAHPAWVRAVTLRSPNDKVFDVVVIDDLAGLVWAANIAAIELHPYLGTAEHFDRPTQVVFDLDPGPPAGLAESCTVALAVRALLDDLGLVSAPKASGGKGVHVHVPVDGATFAESKAFARAIAGLVADRLPDLVVGAMAKAKRAGRVYVDWGQNDPWKSTVAPWSVRGHVVPTVAVPLRWEDVERAAATGDVSALLVLAPDVPARLERAGDPFGHLGSARQRLPAGSAG